MRKRGSGIKSRAGGWGEKQTKGSGCLGDELYLILFIKLIFRNFLICALGTVPSAVTCCCGASYTFLLEICTGLATSIVGKINKTLIVLQIKTRRGSDLSAWLFEPKMNRCLFTLVLS